MRLMRVYFQTMFVGGFIATVPLILFGEKVISEDQFEAAYSPALWSCLNIPFFVESHEWWIELLGTIRTTLRG